MREIKFRAWNPELRKMLYEIEEINISGDNIVGEINHGVLEVKYMKESGLWVDAPVMQYTGLKDWNGKEIYEGDILRFSAESFLIFTDEIGEVQWGTAGWVLTREQLVLCDLEDACPDECVDGEVIGNTYENPELLETQGNK